MCTPRSRCRRGTELASSGCAAAVDEPEARPPEFPVGRATRAQDVCGPPIAQERLVEVAGGKLRYLVKKPWSDGTVALVLEPLDLCARNASLIPPPRFRRIRYHGVLSFHAKLRSEVVPELEDSQPKQLAQLGHDTTILAPEPRKKPWAWLPRHVVEIDVSTYPRCGELQGPRAEARGHRVGKARVRAVPLWEVHASKPCRGAQPTRRPDRQRGKWWPKTIRAALQAEVT
jgi:hypothetical protein